MARGVARIMGFKLILNFNNPYTATDLGDFWGRWHISLSSLIKDYLYIPLGGNRRGPARMYFNIFVAMVLSGIWHGAGLDLHHVGRAARLGRMITREAERTAFYSRPRPAPRQTVSRLRFRDAHWLFFRAKTIEDAWIKLKRIFSTSWLADPRVPLLPLSFILVIWLYQLAFNSKVQGLLKPAWVKVSLAVLMIVCLFICQQAPAKFIYSQY